MTKQDVIKQAYQDAGVEWEKYSARIDMATGWMDFGYCCNGSSDVKDELDIMSVNIDNGLYYNSDPYGEGLAMWRPKSLSGIEDNNKWIKIESEDDLPKDNEVFYFYAEGGKYYNTTPCNLMSFMGTYNFLKGSNKPITHYQPINKPSKPLY